MRAPKVYEDKPPHFTSWDWLLAKPPGVYVLVTAPGLGIRRELWSDRRMWSEGQLIPCWDTGLRGGSWLVAPPWSARVGTYQTGVATVVDEPTLERHPTELPKMVEAIRAWRTATAAELTKWVGAGGSTEDRTYAVLRTDHPYLLDGTFTAADVFVLSPEGRIATLDQHPEFDRWRFGMQTGELWATLGEAWVDGLGGGETQDGRP